ncbi:MAG: biotin/lipoyl-binding protein [Acidimicrobiaceae bacterium]|nr:biotin/lipoyl-binding protein [Acidimicrobiaceae bacterium]
MATDVILPKWGLTMEDGTVVAWYVDEGDHVVEGEVIAEVETEKVENELAAPCAGVIARILVDEDETVDVGTVLAVIAGNEAEATAIGGGQS